MANIKVSLGGKVSELKTCFDAKRAAAVASRWEGGVVVLEQLFSRQDGEPPKLRALLAQMARKQLGVALPAELVLAAKAHPMGVAAVAVKRGRARARQRTERPHFT